MKVLLIRPHLNKTVTTIKKLMFGEPLGLECVSAILKEQGHEVLLVDFLAESKRNLRKYIKSFKPDVVGFTSQCSDISNVLYLAEKTKKINHKITVIVGGIQVTITPEAYFSRYVDYVVKTTTRENMKALMEQIEKDTDEEIMGVFSKKRQFQSTISSCENEYVKPDRDAAKKYRHKYKYAGYQPYATIQTSYGCRNHCSFCIRRKLEGPGLKERPIEDVVAEIEELKEDYVMICDSDFLINEKRLIRFLDLLEERKIKKTYICYGSVNSILEKEYLFKRLSENGVKAVIVGLESFTDAFLKEYNKSANLDDNYKAVRILKKNGIATWGTFILHPDFSKEDFKTFKKYLKFLKPELISFTPLVPHFLTPLYKQYKDRLIYPRDDYEKWSFGDVIIYPSKMSLRRYYFEVLKLGIPANFNWCTIKYCFTTFPVKRNIGLMFGFDQILKVYIKNIFNPKKLPE
ncbi:MAG: radical SAM protein [Epulopiscium sp.]|nr:radical SAM protein [Candidatus Epulonipiscium sp.]HOQ16962.1 radical SAM protein [Defluviitaleaceae bacterium]HPT75731.1 radical SAM protein [Defluviitaleaceae bacterium]